MPPTEKKRDKTNQKREGTCTGKQIKERVAAAPQVMQTETEPEVNKLRL